MGVAPGTRLGPYEIAAQIGAGGMGEVYRATDTNLGRDVAIKVLPAAVAADPDRLARFDREARALAALNHPNIAQIYGLEKGASTGPGQAGTTALVMELVEGPTLAERIAQGPIPVDEALPIAKQIAEALEAAHEQGIVHRDLKPANVKVRPDGTVKVLDFGLAKAMEPSGAMAAGVSQSPTITTPAHLRQGFGGQAMTQAGVILGTAAYMSPEQARGRPVDRRADIWALGVVIYEMLTGTRAFEREDLSLTLAAVMTATPEFERLPDDLPAGLVTFLRRSLERDPARRVQSAGDMRLALEGAFEVPDGQPARPTAAWQQRPALPWSIAAGAVAMAIGFGLSGLGTQIETPRQQPLRRFAIDLGEGMSLPLGQGPAVAISPDGETVVFVGEHGGVRQLYRRALGEFDAQPIPGTGGALMPFFSPDGRSVAFNDGLTIRRISLDGSDGFTVCTSCGEAGFWTDNGSIIFTRDGQLFRVPETGGTPEILLAAMPERGLRHLNNAFALPGGRGVLFEIGQFEHGGVGVASNDREKIIVVSEDGSDPFYSPTGHIVFARNGVLLATPFDVDRFEITGPAVPVLEGVRIENGGAVQAALSTTGVLVYAPAGGSVGTELVWVDRDGQVESVLAEGRIFNAPRVSPDGERIAVQVNRGGAADIWIHESGTLRPFTTTGTAATPIWTPDGRTITFSRRDGDSFIILSAPLDGTEEPRTLLSSEVRIVPEGWSADGARLLVREDAATAGLILVDPANPDARTPYAASQFSEHSAAVSPSREWVAYVSDQTGLSEVYVRPLPGPGRERQVSRGGGFAPVWGATDTELYYQASAGSLLMRAVLALDPWEVSSRGVAFESGAYWSLTTGTHYDVHPHGDRLLMLRQPAAGDARAQLRVVDGWFSVLRARAGE